MMADNIGISSLYIWVKHLSMSSSFVVVVSIIVVRESGHNCWAYWGLGAREGGDTIVQHFYLLHSLGQSMGHSQQQVNPSLAIIYSNLRRMKLKAVGVIRIEGNGGLAACSVASEAIECCDVCRCAKLEQQCLLHQVCCCVLAYTVSSWEG